MRVLYKPLTNEYEVTVNKDDLLTAFISKDELNKLMHDIVVLTYGEKAADELFPIKKGDNDES